MSESNKTLDEKIHEIVCMIGEGQPPEALSSATDSIIKIASKHAESVNYETLKSLVKYQEKYGEVDAKAYLLEQETEALQKRVEELGELNQVNEKLINMYVVADGTEFLLMNDRFVKLHQKRQQLLKQGDHE